MLTVAFIIAGALALNLLVLLALVIGERRATRRHRRRHERRGAIAVTRAGRPHVHRGRHADGEPYTVTELSSGFGIVPAGRAEAERARGRA